MSEIVSYLFGAASFMPHGYCLLWRPDLVAIHAISDALIALAYVAIPLMIFGFLRKRPDIQGNSRKIGYLFIAFILACALTHLTALVTLWWPIYGAQGLIKLVTALVSVATAVVVWRVRPMLLAIPSLKDLERANDVLKAENLQLSDKVGRSRREIRRINERFETALTGSNISVFTQDKDLRYTWIHNPRFGKEADDVIGCTDQDLLPEETAAELEPVKRQVLETGETASTFFALDSEETGTISLDLIVHPTRDSSGNIDGVLCTAIDMTEKNLYEIRLASLASQLAEANRRYEKALDGSLTTVFEQDLDLKYIHVVNPSPGFKPDFFIGKSDDELFPEEDQLKLIPVKKKVLETGESAVIEFDMDMNGVNRSYNMRMEPSRDKEGRITGLIGISIDLTHKRENERQMHLVMRELTHRSKNLLAVIQAMARQTAARSDNTEDFVESFAARLQAMAASHDLLVSQSWYGADLKELVLAHLAQSIDPGSPQIEIEGDPHSITADAAQNLGLALHELTTNAAKYGALSVLGGKLSVSWTTVDGRIRLVWKERGGPEVVPPRRNGFGRMLLERLVGPALDGDVTIDFAPEGVSCVIEFPVRKTTS
ncbi:Blue-light-activated histidine kinase [Labrenzia sp. THAF191b]|uniref:sensor histidine kinase n=1 Tax=unclassified Labrenzia TaxID=2648686 RepID=UPI00126986A2|nr:MULTISPECIES: PAS domain-containing protein [unclassified Labrenzia]QFS98260.1 Blue-light-activated histidine kinase [Labrenzia sp. THAF191b]QFT04574.1 Blue-light-activated histidine kinase [Labrenzia sp. THAF191a]QFT16118.1 Blue-light-activated histidine kinase [Labrenzia sp. THAF187b]